MNIWNVMPCVVLLCIVSFVSHVYWRTSQLKQSKTMKISILQWSLCKCVLINNSQIIKTPIFWLSWLLCAVNKTFITPLTRPYFQVSWSIDVYCAKITAMSQMFLIVQYSLNSLLDTLCVVQKYVQFNTFDLLWQQQRSLEMYNFGTDYDFW